MRGTLIAPKTTHRAAITTPKEAGALLRTIDDYDGHPLTHTALRILAHVLVRPGRIAAGGVERIRHRKANLDNPGAQDENARPHAVPLTHQVITMLSEIEHDASYSPFLFPSLRATDRPMSDNTINAALRRLGFGKDEMTGHGFRALAATLLNEMGNWNPDAVERQLAHADGNSIRRAYARGQERVRMVQHWSDHLDQLRDGATILRPKFGHGGS